MKVNVKPLIKARRLRRWSTAKLAAEIGLSDAMVRKIESGERTSEKTIFKMSEVLEVPMEKILIEESSNVA